MMKLGHMAGTCPPALVGAVYLPAPEGLDGTPAEVVVRVGFFVLAVVTSTVNDWDLTHYRDRWHPGAAFVRITARAMYRIRTSRDLDRWDYLGRRFPDQEPPPVDLHRGPSHCIEWCLLVAGMFAYVASKFPVTDGVWWWVGAAVLLGTGGHVLLDSMTPAGVPGSMIYNYLVHGEVWRRHAFAFRWHEVGRHGVDDGSPITFRTPGIVPVVIRVWPLPVYREVRWVAMVTRTLSFPTITVISVSERSKGCRPGLFYTDSCAEKLGFVPLALGTTAVMALVLTGTFAPVMLALTGWPIFGGA